MVEWLALIVFLILFGLTLRESFEDTEFKSTTEGNAKFGVAGAGVAKAVTRPSLDDSSWKSKVDVQIPIGSNDQDYILALQAFYDKVYSPASVKPTTEDIEKFLEGPDVKGKPLDVGALRIIIATGFHIEPSMSSGSREEQQIKFQPSKALEPKDGRDEVYTRDEEIYRPSDTRIGQLPEGKYAPVVQQATPRRSGESEYKTTGWTQSLFYDVCSVSKTPGCEENVL
jgi:hypothetical protein